MGRSPKSALGLLGQIALWGLMLFGWGVDDVGGFFAHPARLGLLVVALLGTAFVLVSTPDLVDPFRKGVKPVGRQRWLMAVLVGILFFLAWFLPYGDRRGLLVFAGTDALRYAGLALNATGVAVRLAGLRALGRQFSGYVTVQKNHQLVQTGIYRLIRHPM